MRKIGNRTCQVIGTEQALFTIRQKQGNQWFLWEARTSLLKEGVGYEDRGGKKEEILREKNYQ